MTNNGYSLLRQIRVSNLNFKLFVFEKQETC